MRKRLLRKRPRLRRIRRRYRGAGYQARFAAGYRDGRAAGAASYHQPFDGTSIIIPTYNQLGYLRDCIESIQQYTNEPHEIIVVDNGSTDGTPAYLKSLSGRLRYKIFNKNLGFSGGVNQGLMMAKGTSIVILNNDTLVTTNWLSNLLLCLRSDPSIGLVGPVTNFLSSDQKIEVGYKNMIEMQTFAKDHNQPNPQRWRRTKEVMGFCLLLTREVLERVGYLDEGYVIGTCEDVDYYLRIRLLGLDLVIAEDTFIHHYGSVTMRSFLDAALANNAFFLGKWGDWQKIGKLEKVMDAAPSPQNRKVTDFYPSHIVVTGTDSKWYWIENGLRYTVQSLNASRVDVVRLPQMELWNWPIAGEISEAELLQKISSLTSLTTAIVEGGFVITPDSEIYQLRQGKLHLMTTKQAFQTWKLEHRYIRPLSEVEKNHFTEGLPIIAPPIIKADNI